MADKFCTNCGTLNPEASKFCISCGSPLQGQPYQQPYPAYPQQQPYAAPPAAAQPKKKRKGLMILLGIAIGFVLLIVIIVASASAGMGKAAKADYYEIVNDRIPSVKNVLGEQRKVTGLGTEIKNGIRINYWAYESPTPQQDVDAYLGALLDADGYIQMADPDTREFTGAGRNSVDPGYHFEVTAKLEPSGYRITVYYVQGEIEMLENPGTDEPYSEPYVPSSSTGPATGNAGNNTAFSADDDYYLFGGDRVPSVKNILGYRSVPSSGRFTMSGATILQVEYKSDTPNQDAYEYLMHLNENEGFVSLASVDFAEPSGQAKFGRNSVDSGYMIVLTLDFDQTGYKLEAKYLEGEVTLNE
ncbi:MAG: zinc-ribbon domain-containing protein [Firmicutes bacterium]|nr:zinc-ribbon domain-containing protein [Bacillota bacterium]